MKLLDSPDLIGIELFIKIKSETETEIYDEVQQYKNPLAHIKRNTKPSAVGAHALK